MLNRYIIILYSLIFGSLAPAMEPPKNKRHFTVAELVKDGYIPGDHQMMKDLILRGFELNKSDKAQARETFFSAARMGNFLAMHSLGLQFVESDQKFEALEWFNLACQLSWLQNNKAHSPALLQIKALLNSNDNEIKDRAFFAFNNFNILCSEKWQKKSNLINFRYIQIKEMIKHLNKLNPMQNFERLHFLLRAIGDPILIEIEMAQVFAANGNSPIKPEKLLSMIDLADIGIAKADPGKSENLTIFKNGIKGILISSSDLERTYYSDEEYAHFQSLSMLLNEENPTEANFLGLLYAKGLIFRDLPENERDDAARRLYLKADMPCAYENLAFLWYQGRIGKELSKEQGLEQALSLYEKSSSEKAQRNTLAILSNAGNDSHNPFDDFSASDKSLIDLKRAADYFERARAKALAWLLINPSSSFLHFVAGHASLSQFIIGRRMHNENHWELLQAAESHLIIAVTFSGEAANLLKFVTSLLEERQVTVKETEIQKTSEQLGLIADDIPNEHSPGFPVANETTAVKERLKESRPTKKEVKAAKKLRHLQNAKAEVADYLHRSINKTSADRDFSIVFLNNQVKKQFEALGQNRKAQDLLSDILTAPWELKGAGKPEILRGSNLKGCFSRRINDEDRLVYRLLDGDQIQIISCVGHYDI